MRTLNRAYAFYALLERKKRLVSLWLVVEREEHWKLVVEVGMENLVV